MSITFFFPVSDIYVQCASPQFGHIYVDFSFSGLNIIVFLEVI